MFRSLNFHEVFRWFRLFLTDWVQPPVIERASVMLFSQWGTFYVRSQLYSTTSLVPSCLPRNWSSRREPNLAYCTTLGVQYSSQAGTGRAPQDHQCPDQDCLEPCPTSKQCKGYQLGEKRQTLLAWESQHSRDFAAGCNPSDWSGTRRETKERWGCCMVKAVELPDSHRCAHADSTGILFGTRSQHDRLAWNVSRCRFGSRAKSCCRLLASCLGNGLRALLLQAHSLPQ